MPSVWRIAFISSLCLSACATTRPTTSTSPRTKWSSYRGGIRIDTPDQATVTRDILPAVDRVAERYKIDESLILAVVQIESAFRADALSPMGAVGLMQLLPSTASIVSREMGLTGYDLRDPAANLALGTYYLSQLLTQFGGDARLALAAYNAGPTKIIRWRQAGRPIPGSVMEYVDAVLAARDEFELARQQSCETDSAALTQLIQRKIEEQEQAEETAPNSRSGTSEFRAFRDAVPPAEPR